MLFLPATSLACKVNQQEPILNDNLRNLLNDARRRMGQSSKPLEALPPVPGMERRFENGRCLYDGYQRGTALKYWNLADEIWRDPVFRKARAAASGADVDCMVEEPRLWNLFLLIKFFLRDLDSQNVIEFGVYRGASTFFMAMILKEYYPSARIYALDTFTGVLASNAADATPAKDFTTMDFAKVDLAHIQATARSLGLTNIEWVKGLIEDTADGAYKSAGSFGLAHIDVVLHEPCAYAQNTVWDYLAPGGYLVHDDATEPNWPGATQAVEELIRARDVYMEQIWPHVVFRAHGDRFAARAT